MYQSARIQISTKKNLTREGKYVGLCVGSFVGLLVGTGVGFGVGGYIIV